MNIYRIFLIALCNVTCLRASRVVVSLLAIELGAEQFIIGLLIAMYSLFPALLALYAGRLSDRHGTRLPMLLGSSGLVLGLLLPCAYPVLPALFVSAALFGMSYVFYHVAVQNLLGTISGDTDRTRNFNNYTLMISLGGFIGPLFAGFAIDHAGYRWTYLTLALVALVPVITQLLAGGSGHAPRPPGGKRAERSQLAGARDLLAQAPLRRTLIGSAAVLTGTDLFQFYMPIYGHSIGLSASKIGFVLSMVAVAAFVVRIGLPAMVRRAGEERLLAGSLFFGAATYLLFPFFTDVTVLTAIAFMLGLSLGCGQPLSLMMAYARSPQGRSGEVLGLRLTINNFTHIAVPLAFGSLGSLFGLAPVFWINALMLAGGGAVNRARRA
jgi:MFS family permease